MKKFIFAKRVSQLKPSSTLAITSKAKAMKKKGIDIVSFGAGEPDFDTPSHIKEAGVKAIKEGFTRYTPASGTNELKEAISKKLERENNLKYKPSEIAISCGAKHSLYSIFQVLCDAGEEVIIISPYWLSYAEMVRLSQAEPVIVEAHEKDLFVVSPLAIEKKITKKTKAIIVNSPSNPTGAVFGKDTLKAIAEIAIKHNITIISDEIYERLIYDGEKHISIGSLNEKAKNLTLTVNGVSKTYAMTGWRIGYVAGQEDIIKKISALQSHSTSNPTSISQKAALTAITGSQDAVEKMRKEFSRRRDYMAEKINKIKGLSCINPKGAFYIFCNVEKIGLGSVELCARLLREAHVACVPGEPFGSDRYIRLSFATSMDSIKKGLDRIEKWLLKL